MKCIRKPPETLRSHSHIIYVAGPIDVCPQRGLLLALIKFVHNVADRPDPKEEFIHPRLRFLTMRRHSVEKSRVQDQEDEVAKHRRAPFETRSPLDYLFPARA